MSKSLIGPIWLMQPIPYFGEEVDDSWVYEPKIDGWRMQIIRYKDGKVECWGRRLEKKPNWTEKLVWVGKELEKVLPLGSLIDCELTTSRGRQFIPSLFGKNPKVSPVIWVFDVVFYENEFVGDKRLEERKVIIQNLKLPEPFKPVPYKRVVDIAGHLRDSLSEGYEGIVIKRLDSPYILCKDGPLATEYWRKIKSVLVKGVNSIQRDRANR